MKKTFVFLASFGLLLAATAVFAQTGPYLGVEYGEFSGLGGETIQNTAGGIIGWVLSLLGILLVILLVYAGFLWMTARGDDDQAGTAKKIILYAIAGAVVILSAYIIAQFVLDSAGEATGVL